MVSCAASIFRFVSLRPILCTKMRRKIPILVAQKKIYIGRCCSGSHLQIECEFILWFRKKMNFLFFCVLFVFSLLFGLSHSTNFCCFFSLAKRQNFPWIRSMKCVCLWSMFEWVRLIVRMFRLNMTPTFFTQPNSISIIFTYFVRAIIFANLSILR